MNLKWKIFSADLNPVIGSEQKGTRPVLIISDDDYSNVMPLVTILPFTSLKSGRKVYPNEVLITKQNYKETGLSFDSIILAHQIRTISKKRLLVPIGSIENIEIQEKINDALRIHLNL
ncbi:MAG: type II toxin-antitoxin system PemK/MazF family toxin [Actinobacteria bacterium]|nr:type II toxin-antitoxin system PemK/MazF family toxin [Actinomycetota bacterium]